MICHDYLHYFCVFPKETLPRWLKALSMELGIAPAAYALPFYRPLLVSLTYIIPTAFFPRKRPQ